MRVFPPRQEIDSAIASHPKLIDLGNDGRTKSQHSQTHRSHFTWACFLRSHSLMVKLATYKQLQWECP